MLLKVYKSRVWLLLIMLLPFLGTAQISGLPTGWGFTENPSSHIIAVPTTVTFDGIDALVADDWVGAFYDDGGTLKCGGAAQWTGTGSIAVVVNGNDTLEPAKNGFYSNELINWKFYRTATSEEVCVKAYDAGNLELHWVALGLGQITKFTADPVVTCPTYVDPICVTAAPFALAGGMPDGGVYTGVGVTDGTFTPSIAGIGVHTITYTYTNAYGCANSCTFTIEVIQCQICQNISLATGTQFISTYINPTDVNFKNIMTPIFGCLKSAKNSAGKTLAKVGPNWVNNIGNWINTEGYIVTMNCPSTLTICGTPPQVPCNTPIAVSGTKVVPYLNQASLNASTAFNNIKPNLKLVKNSAGKTLAKVGPNWVNNIGNCNAGEGYLVTMNAADNLVYPCVDGGETTLLDKVDNNKAPTTGHFSWLGGNAAENTWTIYLDLAQLNGVDLEPGDEIAIYDGTKIVGVETLIETPVPGAFNESLIAFKVLGDLSAGYVPGHAFSLKCWDQSAGIEESEYTIELADPYGDAWTQLVFPADNNLYSIATIHFGGGCENATANAGADASICAGSDFSLATANATNAASYLWTGGDGTFSSTTVLNPTYTPGSADIAAGNVQLCFTAYATSPCANATDCMTLTINPLPVAECPGDMEVCINDEPLVFGDVTFDPAVEGVGPHTVTLTASNQCGTDECSFVITVIGLPVAECPGDMEVCITDDPLVFGDVTFDPALAGVGPHTITLAASNQCGTDECSFVITVIGLPVVECPADMEVCISDEPLVFGDVTFDPAVAGEGPHTVTLTASNQCGFDECSFVITVIGLPVVECPADMEVCITDDPLVFGDVIFNPATAGVGPHTVTLTTTNQCGFDECSFIITVIGLPVVDCPGDMEVCINDEPLTFGDVTFDPAIEGVGTHTVTLSASNYCGYVECSFEITVIGLPVVECPGDMEVCINDEPLTFGDVSFDPATAGIGPHTVTLTASNQCGSDECSFVITVIGLPVVECPGDMEVCINDEPLVFGDVTFDPAVAGEGQHTVTLTASNQCGFDECSFVITVIGLPVVECPADMEVCINDEPLTFGDVTFDPAAAGVGEHTVTLTASNQCGTDECSFVITVIDAPVLTSAIAGDGIVDLSWLGVGEASNKSVTGHFSWLGGNAAENTWTIYLDLAQLNGVDLEPGDEIAILDGTKIVGVETLVETPVPGSFNESLIAFKVLGDLSAGYVPGHAITLKCYDASAGVENEDYTISFADPYGDAWTQPVFPADNNLYSIATIHFTIQQSYIPTFNIYQDGVEVAANVEGNTYQVTGLPNGVEYCFTVIQNMEDMTQSCHSNELCVTPNGSGCVNPPTADAGDDAGICADGSTYQLSGSVTNSTYYFWSTMFGSGTFDDENALDAVYTPSETDYILGSVELCLTAIGGEECEDAIDCMTLTFNPMPEFDCPAYGPFCVGDDAIVFEGIGTYLYNSEPVAGFDPAEVGNFTFTYMETNGFNCTTSCEFTIVVNPLPVAECPDFAPVCEGSDYITFPVVEGGVYTWNNYAVEGFDPIEAGTAYFVLTVTNEFGCSDFCEFMIVVNPLPTYSYEISDTEICYGTEVTYTEYFTGTAPWTVEYLWNGELETFTTSENPSITSEVLYETSTYEPVSVTDGNGCTVAVNQPSTITVNPLPTYSYDLSATSICYGEEVTYTEYFTGTAPWTVEYYWNGSLETFITSDNPSFTTEILYETSTYEPVSVTDGNGCTVAVDQPATITVHPLPVFECPAYGPYCLGDEAVTFAESGVFTFEGVPVEGWDPYTVGTFTFTYTETTEFGCSASCEFSITVNPAPVAVCEDMEICENAGVYTFPAEMYVEYYYDNELVTSFDPSVGAGDYTITKVVGNEFGCTDECTFTITVLPIPVIVTDPVNVSALYGNVAVFAVTANFADSYQWYGPAGPIEGETGNSLTLLGVTLADEGGYYVTVTNECTTVTSEDASLDVLPWTQTINLTVKNNGVSTNLDLINNSVAFNVASLGANLSNMRFIAPTQTYVPGGATFPWTEERGAILGLKTTWPTSITVEGWPTLGTLVSSPAGASYLPVWSQGTVSVANVFLATGANEYIMGVTEAGKVYWPARGIASLVNLVPGRAYAVNLTTARTFDFNVPIVDGANTEVSLPVNNTTWNDVENTGTVHAIAVMNTAYTQLQAGDVIGVFNQNGAIAGMVQVDDLKSNVFLGVTADNSYTDETEGFVDGDFMTFKVYRNGEVIDATATFDLSMPNTNIFSSVGISAIDGLKLSATSINEVGSDLNVQLFPNPAKNYVNIQTNFEIKSVKVVNYVGQVVFDRSVDQMEIQINTSNFGSGMYFVQIQSADGTVVTKRLTVN